MWFLFIYLIWISSYDDVPDAFEEGAGTLGVDVDLVEPLGELLLVLGPDQLEEVEVAVQRLVLVVP